MKMRLAGVFALALGVAVLASASAYAGNGNGNGHGNGNNGNDKGASEPTALVSAAVGDESSGHGNPANAPGQLKKDDVSAAPAAPAEVSSVGQDVVSAQVGVKPSNDTAHDTHAAASSDETKLYGNGKTAGQIAIENGAAPSTVLHGPGNSQPHKAAPCSGGHEVDVHALKGKRGKACGSQPPPPTPRPNPTPDPGKPGDPGHGPTDSGGNTPTVLASSPSTPSTASAKTAPARPKPVVSPHRGRVRAASGVLSATGAIGGVGTLPFTGFPIWIVMLIGLGLIASGVALRRGSRAPSA
jgi:hypothetical protein